MLALCSVAAQILLQWGADVLAENNELRTPLKLAQSIDAHSGYDLPFPLSIWSAVDVMDCAPAHSFHHSRNTGMYGGYFVFWDRLCGTDASYRTHLLQGQSTGGKGQRSSED